MKQLVTILLQEVEKQCRTGHCNIIRLENFDHPQVYRDLCQALVQGGGFDSIEIKLTEEKFAEFKANPSWASAVAYFHQGANLALQDSLDADYLEKSYVDFGNAMTKWRNKSADSPEIGLSLILLLGTETATDTGGLADTSFLLSPKELIATLRPDYSAWFQPLLQQKALDSKECYKSIHSLYTSLFSKINIDLFRLSQFIDDAEPLPFHTEQEFINHICQTLHLYWNVPSIYSAIPRISTLAKGKKAGQIVEQSCKFMQESRKPLTKAQQEKLSRQFDQYAQEHEIMEGDAFPHDTGLFADYQDFRACLTQFLGGKNKEINGKRLLSLDYGIVNAVHTQKLKKESKGKETQIPLTGDPMEAFIRLFLHGIHLFQEENHTYPSHIKVKVTKVSLADCDDSTIEPSFGKLCQYLGGIIDFFQQSSLKLEGEPLEFSYENGKDPFLFQDFPDIPTAVKTTVKRGEATKIDLSIQVSKGKMAENLSFRWSFSPYSDWLNSFYYVVSDYQDREDLEEGAILPTLVSCARLHEYCACESAHDFYGRLLHFEGKNHYHPHMDMVKTYFEQSSLYRYFRRLNEHFSIFLQAFSQVGLFSCILQNKIAPVYMAYGELMEEIKGQYGSLTQIQKEKLPLLLNCYMITSNPEVLDSLHMAVVLLPSYHPTMLEKIQEKLAFLRDGFGEMLEDFTFKRAEKSLSDLISLSSITRGVDVVLDLHSNLIPCQEAWEYFALYYSANWDRPSSFHSSIVVDEETSETMLKPSPLSNIVMRNLLDYVKTFPSRMDGLTISFLAPKDMQHIVSAIHSIASHWNKQGRVATIHLNIITVHSQKNSASYLRRWLDSYFSQEHQVRVNTSLGNLTGQDPLHFDTQALEKMIQGHDVCFVYQVLHTVETKFSRTEDRGVDRQQGKFPMVFLPDAVSSSHGKERKYCLSQGQFYASTQHTQANAIHSNPDNREGFYQTMDTLSLEEPQRGLLETVHKQCKWVVCLDKAIDRPMLEQYLSKSANQIVGFTTGEGRYGDLNVTVSAKKVILTEIKHLLRKRMAEKFTHWKGEKVDEAAKFCVEELSPYMDGSRILKALNPYDYEVHSYLAYTLMVQKLGMSQKQEGFFLRRLISLDTYLHWFDHNAITEEKTRPDFMLLEIPNTPQNLDPSQPLALSIQVIECKMGFLQDEQVEKATKQLENGLNTLIDHWNGEKKDVKLRYWLNQLYRVLTSLPLEMDDSVPEYALVCQKIRGILDRNYEISWSAALYGFWLNHRGEDFQESILHFSQPVQRGREEIRDFAYHYCGQIQIQTLLLPPHSRNQDFAFVQVGEEEEWEEEIQVPPLKTPTARAKKAEKPIREPQEVISPVIVATPVILSPVEEDSLLLEEKEESTEEKVESTEEKTCLPLEKVRFLIGEDSKTREKSYWEFGHKGLTNRHLLINGNSGCGKTYCIQTLLMEAAQQGISSVVFDYTGGFEQEQLQNSFTEQLKGKITQRYVITEKFPINPFKAGSFVVNGQLIPESSVNIATRISETFASVYKFGDQQKSAIYKAVRDGVKSHGDSMNISILEELLEGIASTSSKTVLSKIQAFIDIDVFLKDKTFDWAQLRDSGGTVYVIQLQGYSRDIQMMLTELLLWDVRNFSISQGSEEKPFILVMDEAQNLDFSEKSPSAFLLTEGRKRGVSAWFATQFMKPQLSDDEIQRLQQAAQKLYFCPPDDGVMTIAKSIDINASKAKDWAERLKKLKKGECVIDGQVLEGNSLTKGKPRISTITSLEERASFF